MISQRFLDPLYGPIAVDEKIMPLVFSPEFQRLRYVRLCNINSLFLTGASEPKRFEHCLGVYHLAHRWSDLRGLSPRDSAILCSAALFHDLLTGPFGHSFQYVMEDNPFEVRFEHANLAAGVQKRWKADVEYDFVENWKDDLYAWKIQVGDDTYGMRKSELEHDPEGTCVTVFEPLNLDVFKARKDSLGRESFTVGLDTIEDLAEQHRRVGNDSRRMMDEETFNRARSVVSECDMVLTGDANAIAAALIAAIALLNRQGAVLTDKDMRPMLAGGALLVGADQRNLRSASYDLRVGKEILYRNQIIELTDEQPRFELPAFSYAIVSAFEIASLPPFVVGRFDLKVSSFFEGLILSNGPQVDPGYKGALFCLLYNASGRPRTLTLGKHFATIDFTMTTRLAKSYGQKYQLKQKMTQFVTDEAMRGPAPNIVQMVDEKVTSVDDRVNGIRNNFWTVAGVVFAIAVAFPVLTIPIAWIEISALHSERQGIEDSEARIKKLLIQARDERLEARHLLADSTAAANSKRGRGAAVR